jgi:hypothetical protein
MLALIPIIGPSLAIATIAGWEAIRLGLIISGNPIAIATAQMIGFVVFLVAF